VDVIFLPLLEVLRLLLWMYGLVVFVGLILHWLLVFQLMNPHHPVLQAVGSVCYQLTNPLVVFIRRYVPTIGTLDFSFLILLLGVYALRVMVERLIFHIASF
jgi:YggT family protein